MPNTLQVEKLVFVTDVPGVLKDGEIIPHVSKEEIHFFIQTGIIYGGMIPKVHAALSVLTPELKEVMIVGGKQSIYEDGKLVGTKITEEGVAATL